MSEKRFSQPCENNKGAILAHLAVHFAKAHQVLEIGAGTGQHAAHFAKNLLHLSWQPTDIRENHPSINAWVSEANCTNVLPPSCFFIGVDTWPELLVDAVFSANTAHIMQANEVALMMSLIAENLPTGGVFCQYGPFKIHGEFTSQSNADFDHHLRLGGYGGIRDIDELQSWAPPLALMDNHFMPANNQLLVWQKG